MTDKNKPISGSNPPESRGKQVEPPKKVTVVSAPTPQSSSKPKKEKTKEEIK